MRTATGEYAFVRGKVIKSIIIGSFKIKHEFIIADIMDDVIIGMDFMTQNGFTLDLRRKVLIFTNVEFPLHTGYNKGTCVRRLISCQRQKIPANSEAVIWAKIDGNDGTNRLWAVEADQQKPNTTFLIGHSLVEPKDGKVPVRVLNLFDTPKTIRKGAIVADGQEVEAVVNCESDAVVVHKNEIGEAVQNTQLERWMEGLTEEQRGKVRTLIQSFWSIFDSSTRGRTAVVKHHIDTGNAKPIRQAPRRVPLARREEVVKLIEGMQQEGVIEPSVSPWSSPVVLVKKRMAVLDSV